MLKIYKDAELVLFDTRNSSSSCYYNPVKSYSTLPGHKYMFLTMLSQNTFRNA